MAIYQGVCRSFRQEMLQGTHAIGTDVLKVALYSSSASIGPDTTAYTATGEVTGTGYSAAGAIVTATISQAINYTDVVFANVTWSGATIEADGALIYNSSKSNKAVVVLNFGGTRSVTASDFVLRFPIAGNDFPVLRIGAQNG